MHSDKGANVYETPDRVSIDLRRFQANDLPEFSKEDLAEARQELMEELLAGERVAGVDLFALLQSEFDQRLDHSVERLAYHFAGIGNLSTDDRAERCERISEWMGKLVAEYLDEHDEIIQERAADIAAQRLED